MQTKKGIPDMVFNGIDRNIEFDGNVFVSFFFKAVFLEYCPAGFGQTVNSFMDFGFQFALQDCIGRVIIGYGIGKPEGSFYPGKRNFFLIAFRAEIINTGISN